MGRKPLSFVQNNKNYYNFYNGSLRETFKIHSAPLNCNSEKVLYLIKCKVCGEAPHIGKAKTRFRYRSNNYKRKHKAFPKENQKIPTKLFQDYCCLDDQLGIDWNFTFFDECETHKQLKEGKTFWHHWPETFYLRLY